MSEEIQSLGKGLNKIEADLTNPGKLGAEILGLDSGEGEENS